MAKKEFLQIYFNLKVVHSHFRIFLVITNQPKLCRLYTMENNGLYWQYSLRISGCYSLLRLFQVIIGYLKGDYFRVGLIAAVRRVNFCSVWANCPHLNSIQLTPFTLYIEVFWMPFSITKENFDLLIAWFNLLHGHRNSAKLMVNWK